jgi:hypothetical protein
MDNDLISRKAMLDIVRAQMSDDFWSEAELGVFELIENELINLPAARE